MILSYRDKRTELFAQGEFVRALQGFGQQAERRLAIFNAAPSLDALRGLPSKDTPRNNRYDQQPLSLRSESEEIHVLGLDPGISRTVCIAAGDCFVASLLAMTVWGEPGWRTYSTASPNRLEALKGERRGQYSIRINQRWRVCFEWKDGESGPSNVEIVDYHA